MSVAEKLKIITDNTSRVFEVGKTEGYNEGIEEGIQTEYDRFWDAYLKQGKWDAPGSKMNCNFLFAGFGWKDENFKPKYILRPSMAMQMFYYSYIGDLAALLEASGSGLDTTVCSAFQNMFQDSGITRVPEISITVPNGESAIGGMFRGCTRLVEIQKIILGEGVVVAFNNVFTDTKSLTTVTFEGTICRDINFQWSPLSATSINSVITHLSGTETGKTATFKLSAVNAAFETAVGAADGSTSQTWLNLVATKPNWTIALV